MGLRLCPLSDFQPIFELRLHNIGGDLFPELVGRLVQRGQEQRESMSGTQGAPGTVNL